jgi:hypothetical protein
VAPTIDQVKALITKATGQVKGLKGKRAEDEVVPLQNVAQLVADILIVRISSFRTMLLCLYGCRLLAPPPYSRWPPHDRRTYRRLGWNSWTGWVSHEYIRLACLTDADFVACRPLLSGLLTALIPVVAGLVAALIPLVTSLLASVSALVTSLGLGPLIVTLGL